MLCVPIYRCQNAPPIMYKCAVKTPISSPRALFALNMCVMSAKSASLFILFRSPDVPWVTRTRIYVCMYSHVLFKQTGRRHVTCRGTTHWPVRWSCLALIFTPRKCVNFMRWLHLWPLKNWFKISCNKWYFLSEKWCLGSLNHILIEMIQKQSTENGYFTDKNFIL